MELITIKKSDTGKSVVSARELYDFLEVGERFGEWAERMLGYGFSQNVDYQAVTVFVQHSNSLGGVSKKDFALTVEAAKEIAMLQRSEKGKQARLYFIECEKKLAALPSLAPTNLKEALLLAYQQQCTIEEQGAVIAELAPKADFYDAVTDSTDAVDLGTAAKVLNLGFGRTTLFEKLRDNKILMKNNQPFQKYIDAGWFRVIETSWTHPNGDTHVNFKTVVYQKGLDGIRKMLSTENF